jgi:hypothetical protein
MVFEKFRLWLEGYFVCVRCGEVFFPFSFGFGKAICPECYSGERTFMVFDEGFWLNRLMRKFLGNEYFR